MKKIALSLILLGTMAFAAEANATAPKAEANATKAEAAAPAAGDAAAGKAKFAVCAGCHGANGEKKALGKSNIIAGWDASKTVEALKEYKAGTRKGHGMEAVMKGQAAALSDADMANVAAYVASLKK